MPHTITREVFSFEELDDKAKAVARDWYRDGALDYDWRDSVYEDVGTCAALLGIELRQEPVKLMNGNTRYDPCIWFSGFSSQGDGACFEGAYAYIKGCARAIRRHASQDAELHRIADDLVTLQRGHFYRLEARCVHSGHYYHSNCMSVDVGMRDGASAPREAEEGLTDILRSFADWIYRQLQCDYEFLMSDEQVDESIAANEYEFSEDGRVAWTGPHRVKKDD